MRANRLLGARLHELELITMVGLESAIGALDEEIRKGILRRCSILRIMATDLAVLNEDDLLNYLFEHEQVSPIDLRFMEIPEVAEKQIHLEYCWASWTVPFDFEDGVWSVASSYYLCQSVRDFWEKRLGARITWYSASMDSISDALEGIESKAALAQAAEQGSKVV